MGPVLPAAAHVRPPAAHAQPAAATTQLAAAETQLRLRRRGQRVAPLSFAQERLWFIDQAAPGSVTYNVPLLLRWREQVDVAALRSALAAVVQRHEVLRTTYQVRDGRPVQVIGDSAPASEDAVPLDVVDLAGRAGGWHRVNAEAAQCAREPFDLAARPPVRCVLWRGVPGGDAMLLVIHHIAVDGWSLDPLLTDLDHAYGQALAGRRPQLAELPVQYADYAVWDREMLELPEAAERLAARMAELLEVPRDLTLAGWRPAPEAPEGARNGAEHTFAVPPEVWAGAHALARRLRVTPFVVFLCAFQAVLQRWSGRDEFLVGALSSNRPHAALAGLCGFLVNTVPVRCRLEPQWSFAQLCTQSRAEALRSLSLQRLPLDQLAAKAAALRPDQRGPLVDVGFAMQNLPPAALAGWQRWEPVRVLHTATAKFDLMLLLEERPDGPVGAVESDTDRYPADLGPRLAESFLALLAAAVADPDRPLWRLPIARRAAGGYPPSVLAGPRRDLVDEWLTKIAAGAEGEVR